MHIGPSHLELTTDDELALQRMRNIMQTQGNYSRDPAFQRDLIRLVQAPGKTIAGLARLLGVKRQGLHRIVINIGIKPGELSDARRQRRAKDAMQKSLAREDAHEERLQIFSQLWMQGHTNRIIARHLKMHAPTVSVLICNFRKSHPLLFPVRNLGLSHAMTKASQARRTRRTARVPALTPS